MAEAKIIVCAKIVRVESVVRKHKVVRDHEAEKRVKQELTDKLKKNGTYEKMPSSEFQSRYRAKLRAYAEYIDGHYVAKDEDDGSPGLLVSKPMWENDLCIKYSVDGRSYTQNVTYCTETKCLEAGNPFYITVLKNQPMTIRFQSHKDYRPPESKKSDGGCGCVLFLMAVGALILWFLYGGGG